MVINPDALINSKLDDIQERRILFSGDGYTVALMSAEPGEGPAPHSHPHAQFIYVISGEGAFINDNVIEAVKGGESIPVYPNKPHGLYSVENKMTWLEFFVPERPDIIP